jgi:hypothetical protein
MDRVRTITIDDREVRLREHALSIGGIPVIWMLEDARYDDGTVVPDEVLDSAGIRHRQRLPEDD